MITRGSADLLFGLVHQTSLPCALAWFAGSSCSWGGIRSCAFQVKQTHARVERCSWRQLQDSHGRKCVSTLLQLFVPTLHNCITYQFSCVAMRQPVLLDKICWLCWPRQAFC